MPPYRVSIDLDFELADDVEARERLEPEARGLAHQLDRRYGDDVKRTIKIRRLYGDRPPRLLAKWPDDETVIDREEIKDLAYRLDPECWESYSGKPLTFKRAVERRRTTALEAARRQLLAERD